MGRPFSDVSPTLAPYAASLNEKVLSHLLQVGALEARNAHLSAPLPILGVWDWDITSDRAYLDTTCARMFGVEPNKGVASSAWMPAIHPEDIHSVTEQLQKTFVSGGEYQLEYRLIVNDRPRWILSKGYCTLDSSKRPERFPG